MKKRITKPRHEGKTLPTPHLMRTAQPAQLVVTDADGTLWSFWNYFCPAMRRVIPILAKELGMEMDDVSRDIGSVMDKYGTHEFPWALELTQFRRTYRGTPQEFQEKISRQFWHWLDHYRARYLELYRDVRETLTSLQGSGIPVVILSDAPMHMAIARAHQMGVGGYVDAIYALDTPEPDPSEFFDPYDVLLGRQRMSECSAVACNIRQVTLERHYEKPHTHGVEAILKYYGVDPLAARFIGDNRAKDGGVAQKAGIPYISADYGTILSPEDRQIVSVKFKPLVDKADSGHNPLASQGKTVPLVAESVSYKEVLRHLGRFKYKLERAQLSPSATSLLLRTSGH